MRKLRVLVIGALLLSGLYAPIASEAAGAPLVSRVSAGTLCSDGWVSQSTGSGTCSWHGGVSGGGSNFFGAPSQQGKFGQPPSNSWNSKPWGNSWSLTPITTPRPLIFNPAPTIRPFPTIRPLPTLSPIQVAPLLPAPSIKFLPLPTPFMLNGWVKCKKGTVVQYFAGGFCPAGWSK